MASSVVTILLTMFYIVPHAQILKEFHHRDFMGYAGGLPSNYTNISCYRDTFFVSINTNKTYFGNSYPEIIKIKNNTLIRNKLLGPDAYSESIISSYMDTINKYIYYCGDSGYRPSSFTDYSAVIYKTDFNNNILDSLILQDTYFFGSSFITSIRDTIYVLCQPATTTTPGEPNVTRISIIKADKNLNLIDYKTLTDTVHTRAVIKMEKDKQEKLSIFYTNINFYPLNKTIYEVMKVNTNLTIDKIIPIPFIKNAGEQINFFNENDLGFTILSRSSPNDSLIDTFNIRPTSVLTKYDRFGKPEYTKFYPQLNLPEGVIFTGAGRTNDNGYLISNSNLFDTLPGLLKLDSLGNQQWYLRNISSTRADGMYNVGQTSSGIYYFGYTIFHPELDFPNPRNSNPYSFCLLTIDSTAKTNNGIPIINQNDITIYPNPCNGILTINMPDDAKYELKIINSIGQLISDNYTISQQTTIDLSNYGAGTYLLNFVNQNTGNHIHKKLIVVKDK